MKLTTKKQEKIFVTSQQIYCDGSVIVGGGHPAIYLNIKNKNHIKCPYCGLIYEKK
ncbi:MAG: zinc-finger domain-containing protein [Alphaproteobacteria bacterium]